jgi:hypothetical protein
MAASYAIFGADWKQERWRGETSKQGRDRRHCEHREAIHAATERKNGLLRRVAPRNDDVARQRAA